MIARGFDAQGRALSPNKLDQLFKDFIAHYSEHLTDRSLPFPGLTEASYFSPRPAAVLPFARTSSKHCPFDCLVIRARRPLRCDLRSGHLRHAKA